MNDSLFETRTPAPKKPRVKVDLVGDELVLTWRGGSAGGYCLVAFLAVWLTGWSAGCAMMLHELLTDFKWFMLLFSTPFFAAWVAVACVMVGLLFGRQTLVLAADQLRLKSWALVTYAHRSVPLDEVERATTETVTTSNDDGPPTIQNVIEIKTLGQPMQFAKGVGDDEAPWLAEIINVCLDRLAPQRTALSSVAAMHQATEQDDPIDQSDTVDMDADSLAEPFTDKQALVYTPGRDQREQPSDSPWQLGRNGRATEFTCPGRWSLGGIAGTTFINLFWNGIVGVFVYQLVREFHWFLAVFLIPFELIGLVILAAWLFSVTAPLWGLRYSIRFGRVEKLVWGPLYRSTRSWEFERIERLEITEPGFSDNSIQVPPERLSKGDYRLTLVDDEEHEVVGIDALTEGDALWMADVLMREHPDMFTRRR